MVIMIYKSYWKWKKKGKVNGRLVFKKDVIMFDDYFFKFDFEVGVIKFFILSGRVELEFYLFKYYEKFRDWKIG